MPNNYWGIKWEENNKLWRIVSSSGKVLKGRTGFSTRSEAEDSAMSVAKQFKEPYRVQDDLDHGYKLDREKERKYASRYGYYWLPCAICGFYSGGHEGAASPAIPIKDEPGIHHGVCNRHPNAADEYVYVRAHVERVVSSI